MILTVTIIHTRSNQEEASSLRRSDSDSDDASPDLGASREGGSVRKHYDCAGQSLTMILLHTARWVRVVRHGDIVTAPVGA